MADYKTGNVHTTYVLKARDIKTCNRCGCQSIAWLRNQAGKSYPVQARQSRGEWTAHKLAFHNCQDYEREQDQIKAAAEKQAQKIEACQDPEYREFLLERLQRLVQTAKASASKHLKLTVEMELQDLLLDLGTTLDQALEMSRKLVA